MKTFDVYYSNGKIANLRKKIKILQSILKTDNPLNTRQVTNRRGMVFGGVVEIEFDEIPTEILNEIIKDLDVQTISTTFERIKTVYIYKREGVTTL